MADYRPLLGRRQERLASAREIDFCLTAPGNHPILRCREDLLSRPKEKGKNPLRVQVISAHPDDVDFGCG
ncbi:MAG: hypothetical protein ABSB32_05420, partial [Thermodesulfobacteriota bacterium]